MDKQQVLEWQTPIFLAARHPKVSLSTLTCFSYAPIQITPCSLNCINPLFLWICVSFRFSTFICVAFCATRPALGPGSTLRSVYAANHDYSGPEHNLWHRTQDAQQIFDVFSQYLELSTKCLIPTRCACSIKHGNMNQRYLGFQNFWDHGGKIFQSTRRVRE